MSTYFRTGHGEFTPQWNKATVGQNIRIGSVDIPINPQYRYKAICSEFTNGGAKAYTVEISQKLIVVKSRKTGDIAQYILTLIPDKEYYARNKGDISNRFLNCGDKGEFSGLAIWLYDGMPVRVNKYKQGAKVAGITILGITDKQVITERVGRMLQQLRKIKIVQSQSISATRYGGEDWWDVGSEGDDYWDIGAGFFEDDNGNILYDWDGDDKPDSVWIPPVEVTPDPMPDDEPVTPEDNSCPFCGGDPCACSDEPYIPDDDWDYPSIGDDDDPIITPINIQEIIDKLKGNKISNKLLDKIKLDRIKATPAPPDKPDQKGVTRKDGSIEIHDGSPMVLLEELMHRHQQGTDIHGQYKGNVEVEAKLFVWDYLTSEYSMNDIRGNFGPAWMEFGIFAENPCAETWDNACAALFRMGYDFSGFPTSDYSDFKDDNYQNLK